MSESASRVERFFYQTFQPSFQKIPPRQDFQVDANRPKRQIAKSIRVQLDQVLAGAEHGRRPTLVGPAGQAGQVRGV